MGKDFIDEFIPSKDTRAYLHSIHHEFTDLENGGYEEMRKIIKEKSELHIWWD